MIKDALAFLLILQNMSHYFWMVNVDEECELF